MILRRKHPDGTDTSVVLGGGAVGIHATYGSCLVAVVQGPRKVLSEKERERQRVYSANYRATHK